MNRTRRLHILLAEDNKVNQEIASRLLGLLGHAVTIAGNGSEAVALVAAQSFDLVLMDVMMPGMNGLEAARAIRASAGPQSRLPILALTANAFTSDREACLAAGMDDFLTKPFGKAALAAALAPWTIENEVSPTSNDRLESLRRDLGEPVLVRLLATFVADAATLMAGLRAALDAGDRQQVETILHTVKGSAANMGFSEVEALAIAMAQAPDATAWTRLAGAFERATTAALRLRADIAAAS